MSITNEEKINYIYKTLKKQERRFILGMILKILFILFLIYAYYNLLPSLTELIKDFIKENLTIQAAGLSSIKHLMK